MSSHPNDPVPQQDSTRPGLSRRKLFGAAGVGAAVVGAAGAGALAGRASAAQPANHLNTAVAFRGEHQAGIVTEAQDRMHFATFDVTTNSRDDVIKMLADWTEMAERMTQGEEAFANGATGQNLSLIHI